MEVAEAVVGVVLLLFGVAAVTLFIFLCESVYGKCLHLGYHGCTYFVLLYPVS